MSDSESSYRCFLEGDRAAFEAIVAEHRLGLIFFINRFVRDPDTAEDIAIDVFVYVLLHPRRYNFKTSVKTYLFMLARSRALDWLRRQKAFPTEPIQENFSSQPELEALVLADERKQALHRALDGLSPDMQQAVHLVYFAGFTYAQAGQVMKKTPKQIDNLLSRAKSALRAVLRKEGMEL